MEAKEAEDKEQDSTYINMVCNIDYANLVQAQHDTPVEGEASDDYVKIDSSTSSPPEAPEMSVQCVLNKGYVSLSSAESLMVGSGKERVSLTGLGATDEETEEEGQALLCL